MNPICTEAAGFSTECVWKNGENVASPGEYESALFPAPAPESWAKLKLVIEGKSVSAFVNGANKPALSVESIDNRIEAQRTNPAYYTGPVLKLPNVVTIAGKF